MRSRDGNSSSSLARSGSVGGDLETSEERSGFGFDLYVLRSAR